MILPLVARSGTEPVAHSPVRSGVCVEAARAASWVQPL